MECRKINNENVSLLGMGCMRLPLVEGSDQIDYEHTAKMVELAIEVV
jgi:predicted aldo/keto reductase-like oxidoreductase